MGVASDTIAAISTAPGQAAIGIVRMSGGESIAIADSIFRGKRAASEMKTHTLQYGRVVHPESNVVVDSVLLAVMRAPNSYTGEDMVEIHCHGGPVVLGEVLDLLYRLGAVPAEAGEFSRRAFLNGRMALCEAEAVLDLINARTREAARSASMQLAGKGKESLQEIKRSIVRGLAMVEASIDFPEDDTLLDGQGVAERIAGARGEVLELIEKGDRGRLMREGVTVAIVGKPNVGKSSLLNALLKEDRAIVTSVPGTTRDYLAEWMDISGVPVRLVDTAGLRDSECAIEKEGVMRAKKAIEASDFVLLLLDWSCRMTEEDTEAFKAVEGKGKLVLLNKCDLKKRIDSSSLQGWLAISAKYGDGLGELRERMKGLVWGGDGPAVEALFTRTRHLAALKKCHSHLQAGLVGLEQGKPPEIVALELRDALSALGEIAGETTGEDVLDAIFSEFCIGK
ncbi:MAG: tRNA uridine-5-carboxymethylaminomethyl(34) synthesis GTPase MnmE [Dehalococcoidia bacterium]